ncbi:MAG: glycosyltransferase family 39 protein [Polyangiaceae bacterium]
MNEGSEAGEERAAGEERDLWFSGALFVLALLPRLYVALAWPREPVWDGHYYDFGARRIAEGLGYSDDVVIGGRTVWHPWCHYPVGYSGFLAAFYALFGPGARVGPVANAVVGALTVVLVHRLARFATTGTRARVAGALTAVHPGLIAYTALLMTEPLSGFGLLLGAWLFARHRDRAVRGGALAGLAIGLSALVRPPSLLLAPALALFGAWRGEKGSWWSGWGVRLGAAGVACAMAMAAVLPWTVRNCRVMDGCALVSTNAGWNLMIGAFPRATGRFETLRAGDGCAIVTGQVQQDRCWLRLGMEHIVSEPGRWLSLAPKKLGFTFDHESFPMGYLGEANPRDWPEARKARGRAILGGASGGLLGLAALAGIPWPQRVRDRKSALSWAALAGVLALMGLALFAETHPVWPLALAAAVLPFLGLAPRARGERARGGQSGVIGYMAISLLSVAVIAVVFFGEDRYHMVASPAVCLLAACALRRKGGVAEV